MGDIQLVGYLTAVDSRYSNLSSVQMYHYLISGSVEVQTVTTAINSGSIGKIPVSSVIINCTSVKILTTNRLLNHAEQGITTFTNVLQGHETVVLVCCTVE